MRFPMVGHGLVVGVAAWLAASAPSAGWSQERPLAPQKPGGQRMAADPQATALLRPFQSEASRERPSPDDMAKTLEKGSSANDVRADALAGLPLDKLTPQDRRSAMEVLDSVGLFRRLPTISIECDPGAYDFFVRNPDGAVNIWRVLEISDFQMTRVAPGSYKADAGDGTVGTLRMLHRGPDEHLVLCGGEYKSPLLPRAIEAQALLHLETKFVQERDGTKRAVHRLNMFVAFPSQTVEAAAKLISPMSNMVLDRNFKEVSLFMHMMTLAMTRQPGWVEQLANRLDDLPEPVRQELVDITARAFVAEVRRQEALRQQQVEPVRSAVYPAAGEQRR